MRKAALPESTVASGGLIMWGFARQWLVDPLRRIRTNSHDHLDHPGHRLRDRRHVARRKGATEKR
jgi:hypothetical protein